MFIIEPYRQQVTKFKNLAKAMGEKRRDSRRCALPLRSFSAITLIMRAPDFQYDPHLKFVDEMAANWQKANGHLKPKPNRIYKLATIQDAVETVRELAAEQHNNVGVDCLVTGTWGGDIMNLTKLPIRYSKDYVYTPP